MEDFLHKFNHSIKSEQLIEFKISHIMELFVICYGQIQRIKEEMDMGLHLEEQDIVGAKILQINSIIKII